MTSPANAYTRAIRKQFLRNVLYNGTSVDRFRYCVDRAVAKHFAELIVTRYSRVLMAQKAELAMIWFFRLERIAQRIKDDNHD